MAKNYATTLTRDYLEYLGITDVSKDGTKIMKGDKELTQHSDGRYMLITLYDPAIRKMTPADLRTNTTGQFSLGVHRIVFCWYNRVIPTGMVIDHRNNNKLDNRLENLQLFTPGENIWKDKEANANQIKCKLNKPRSFYEEKLAKYEALNEEAKANKDQKEAHKQRTNIAQTKARLRYYDSHIDEVNNIKAKTEIKQKEVNEMTEFKKDLLELKEWKKVFKEHGNKKLWHECCTIEKIVKEKGIEAEPVVKHALEVIHTTFGR